MSDVFISYAREDREIAERLAGALTAEPLDVWWDFELGAGDAFREKIEAELTAARVVIVLWSPHSVRSSFVRDEASRAHARGALVPLVIGGLDPGRVPLGFGELHTQNIADWSGEPGDEHYVRLLSRLRQLLSEPAPETAGGESQSDAGDEPAGSRHAPRARRAGANRPEWTAGRTLLLVLLCLDITIVALWLIIYSRFYATVAVIVGGMWAAILAALGRFRIRTKETSLSAFLGLPPVSATIATYSCLILAAIPLFALWALPVHRVEVSSPVQDPDFDVAISVLLGEDTAHAYAGPPQWRFHAKRGPYVLNAARDGYQNVSRSFQVGWFTFAHRVELGEFLPVLAVSDPERPDSLDVEQPEGDSITQPSGPGDSTDPPARGTLHIRSQPTGMDVFVAGVRLGMTPLTESLPPGSYRVEVRQRHVDDERFGYYMTRTVRLVAGVDSTVDVTPQLIELPSLLIRPLSAGDGASFYLDSANTSGLLGQVAGATGTFMVFPGEHVVLKKLGDATTQCSRIMFVPGRQQRITC